VAAVVAAPVRVMFDETIKRRRPPLYSGMPAPPEQTSLPGRARA
jgi:hypothetical protein